MDPAQISTPAAAAGERWLQRGILLAVLLACAVAVSPNPADPDLWGHVRYGRDLLRDGLPQTATYTYSATGHRWVNHENLAEAALALGADYLGPQGLLIAKCLLGVGVVGLILRNALRGGVGLPAACGAALLVATNLSYHWSVRPHVLGFVMFALLIALLQWCFAGWEGSWRLPWRGSRPQLADFGYSSQRLRWLWLAPPLLCVWTNTHGGFVAGYAIFAAYLCGRGLEAFVAGGRATYGLLRRFALMIAAGGLATLVNPYSGELHLWLLDDLWQPRPEIREWWAPDFTSTLYLPLWLLLGATTLALAFTRRSRDFTHVMLLGLTLWQALTHQRHIPFFAILFGFWLAPHLESAAARLKLVGSGTGASAAPPGVRWGLGAGLAVAFVLLGGKLYGRLSDLPVQRDAWPVAAMQYIADHELRGKLVVTFNWAQYAIDAVGPSRPDRDDGLFVECDGRLRTCYPQKVIDLHFDFILGQGEPGLRYRSPRSQAPAPARALERRQPDLVLLDRGQPHAQRVMEQEAYDWTLLYQDSLAQLWGRRSVFDDPASPHYLPPAQREIGDAPQVGSVTWPALPVRGRLDSRLAREDGERSTAESRSAPSASDL